MNKDALNVVCFSCGFGWGYLSGRDSLAPKIENWIPVTCSGKIDAIHILKAFKNGADGILILNCPNGDCHFQDGNFRNAKMVHLLKRVVEEFGIEPERILIKSEIDPDGLKIPQYIDEMKEDLSKLGPVRRQQEKGT